MFSSRSFIFCAITFKAINYFQLISVWYEARDEADFCPYEYGYLIVPALFMQRSILCPLN